MAEVKGTQIGNYLYILKDGPSGYGTYRYYNPIEKADEQTDPDEPEAPKRGSAKSRPVKFDHQRTLLDNIKDSMGAGVSLPIDPRDDKRAYEAGPDFNIGAFPDVDTQEKIMRHKNRLDRKRKPDDPEYIDIKGNLHP